MSIKSLIGVAVISLIALSGCSGAGTKETIGTLGGAAIGGLFGSQFGGGTGQMLATAGGGIVGMFIGNQVGASLDDNDRRKAKEARQQAALATLGKTISWNNPRSGNSGSVTASRQGTASNGQQCREFHHTVKIGGKEQSGYGTACRQVDGAWLIN